MFADFFFQNKLFKRIYSFRNTVKVSNSLNPDQAQHFDWPDLGPNCLQRLPGDHKCRQRVKLILAASEELSHTWESGLKSLTFSTSYVFLNLNSKLTRIVRGSDYSLAAAPFMLKNSKVAK